jgi:hypothetical protein
MRTKVDGNRVVDFDIVPIINKTSETLRNVNMNEFQRFGPRSRVTTDRGGENNYLDTSVIEHPDTNHSRGFVATADPDTGSAPGVHSNHVEWCNGAVRMKQRQSMNNNAGKSMDSRAARMAIAFVRARGALKIRRTSPVADILIALQWYVYECYQGDEPTEGLQWYAPGEFTMARLDRADPENVIGEAADGNGWVVQSFTEEERTYSVDIRLRCTCEDWKKHRVHCKHVYSVLLWRGFSREVILATRW